MTGRNPLILYVKNISIEGPGFIGDFYGDMEYVTRTVDLSRGDKLPEDFDGISAVVVLGGPMNVYEEAKYPYLKDEDAFIKRALDKDMPFLGICLGAQLLAKAAGARVKKADQEEIGFYEIRLTREAEEDPIFEGIDKNIDVFQWHGDTFDMPDGGALLATSNVCVNQAFRAGKNAYGFQFHIEVRGKDIADWSGEYLDTADKTLRQKGLDMLTRYEEVKSKLHRNAEKICSNFCKIM